MAKEGVVIIAGPIGTFEYRGKQIVGVQLADIVAKVTALPEDTKVLRVKYDTPGGREDVGTNIYDYLMSLKPRLRIISEQIGMVGSIGTKPWFAGDDRIATRGMEFFVHNPWVPQLSGDADYVEAEAAKLRQSENSMRAFYMERTGITEEGIAPLMKAETTFKDEQAVELKFATELQEAHKIAAYTMKQTTKEKLNAVLAAFKNLLVEGEALSMAVELEDGKKVEVATEDISKLDGVAIFSVGEDGAPTQVPPADGDYKLKDGRVITVAGGVITATKGVPAPPADDAGEVALSAKLDSLLAATQNAKNLKSEVLAAIDQKFIELRNDIKGTHKPVAYTPEKEADLVAEWERSFKANEHAAMRKNEPEKYKLLYYAKFKKVPNI
jgi:ATP-dependent protease ClpP protease subunit